MLKSAGGGISYHEGMVQAELNSAGVAVGLATLDEQREATTKARDKYEATVFLLNSDQTKYGRLVQELANDFNKGRDEYPTSLTGADADTYTHLTLPTERIREERGESER